MYVDRSMGIARVSHGGTRGVPDPVGVAPLVRSIEMSASRVAAARRPQTSSAPEAPEAPEQVTEAPVIQDESPEAPAVELDRNARQRAKLEEQASKLADAVKRQEEIEFTSWLAEEAKYTKAVTEWLSAEGRYTQAHELLSGIESDAKSAVAALNSAVGFMDGLMGKMATVQEQKLYRELGHTTYLSFAGWVCKTHLKDVNGGGQKEMARFLAGAIPGISQRKLAEETGIPQSQISRAVSGSTAGSGDNGHGGSRTPRATKPVSETFSTAVEKVTGSAITDGKVPVENLRAIVADALRVVIDGRAALVAAGETVVPWSQLEPRGSAELHSGSEGTTAKA